MMGEQAAKTKKTETSLPEGKIVQVSGPVVDVKFERGPLPEIRDALTVENQGKTCVMEAAKHMGNNIVRCIMLSASEGLSRDMKVTLRHIRRHKKRLPVPASPLSAAHQIRIPPDLRQSCGSYRMPLYGCNESSH